MLVIDACGDETPLGILCLEQGGGAVESKRVLKSDRCRRLQGIFGEFRIRVIVCRLTDDDVRVAVGVQCGVGKHGGRFLARFGLGLVGRLTLLERGECLLHRLA